MQKNSRLSFNLNSAKSFIGKNVNLHLKDGSVLINVQLTQICKGNYGEGYFAVCTLDHNHRKIIHIALRNIAYADPLNYLKRLN
jgi:hypothetical protein